MQVVLYRIDERLIHGQVMAVWLGKTGANTVYIVDEVSAKDDFMKQIFRLAAPANVKVDVLTVAAFRAKVNGSGDNSKAIILFKGPKEAKAALETDCLPGELIIGNVATGPKRKKYTKFAYLSEEEKDMLAALQAIGWRVYTQLLPGDPKNEFKK